MQNNGVSFADFGGRAILSARHALCPSPVLAGLKTFHSTATPKILCFSLVFLLSYTTRPSLENQARPRPPHLPSLALLSPSLPLAVLRIQTPHTSPLPCHSPSLLRPRRARPSGTQRISLSCATRLTGRGRSVRLRGCVRTEEEEGAGGKGERGVELKNR